MVEAQTLFPFEENEAEEREASRLQEARDNKDAILALLKSKGWELVSKFAKKQIALRQKTAMGPPGNNNDYANNLYLRGELGGLTLVISAPQFYLDEADGLLDLYAKAEEMEKKNAEATANDANNDGFEE